MPNPDSHSACGLLYVDDEEMSLKYFRKALPPQFLIFTATSAREGLEVLRREAGRIGVVVSDQRMPNMLGAEFLGIVREEFPALVRILATAYTDLTDAIAAVNTGHIYQYVVKPWNINELNMVMTRAVDYYHVLSERNELLAVKLTTLQRILCSDRVKWLLLWGRSLGEAERAAFERALFAFVAASPEALNPLAGSGWDFGARSFEIGALLRDEFQNASTCLDALDSFRAGAIPPLPALPPPLEDALARLAADFPATSWNVADALRAFLAALIATEGVQEVFLDGGRQLKLRVIAAPAVGEVFSGKLFALLTGRASAGLSGLLLEALLALALAGGSLEISMGDDPADKSPRYRFPLETAGNVIDALCEKFEATDILRL